MTPERNPWTISHHSPPLFSQPRQPQIYFFLYGIDSSGQFWLPSLQTMCSRLVHLATGVRPLFHSCKQVHCMDIAHSIYPFISWWIFWLHFHFLWFWVTLQKIIMYRFLCEYMFSTIFLGEECISRNGIAGAHGKSLSNFVRNLQPVSIAAAPFYIPQPCMRLLISSHSRQPLLFSIDFLNFCFWYFSHVSGVELAPLLVFLFF